MLGWNTKTYIDWCTALYSTLSNLYFNMSIEIDFMKCYFGFLGVFVDDPFDCVWKEYGISDAANFGVRDWDQEWVWVPEVCVSDFLPDLEDNIKKYSPFVWF